MPDNLRDRIAAALAQHDCEHGHCSCGLGYGGDTFSRTDAELHRADAVIEALREERPAHQDAIPKWVFDELYGGSM